MAFTRSPAFRPRSCAAGVTAMTNGTLSPPGAVRSTTPGSEPRRPLRSEASVRRSPAAAPGALWARKRTPPRSSAEATSPAARAASCAARNASSDFSVSRSFAVRAAILSGSSSDGAFSDAARPETSARSFAWCR